MPNKVTDELLIADEGNFLKITAVEEEIGWYGIYAVIEVGSFGFSGWTRAWIAEEDMQTFCKQLVRLEAVRQGEATLRSTVPGEFTLSIHSISKAGHMGIVGEITDIPTGRRVVFSHTVQFGFEFDPSDLIRIVAHPLIRRYAVDREAQ